jgi:hypothetical protein
MNQVPIKRLSRRLATRAAGLKAFNKLMTLDFSSITIDLNDAPALTYTFLDEMIYRAIEVGILSQIRFKSDDKATIEKLAHIAKARDVEIVSRSSTQKKHPTHPKEFSRLDGMLVEDKNNLQISNVARKKTRIIKPINIRRLTDRFVTRNKAVEALTNLEQQEFDLVSIGLNNELKLSYSFLDEIVLKASKTDLLGRIIFRTDDEATLDKLAYISGTRNLDISVSSVSHQKRQILIKTFSRLKANLVENKDNLTRN